MHLLPGCIGYLAGVEKITGRVLNATEDLRVISRNGTGVDNIDLEAAGKKKIQICRTAGANAQGVAELTLGLLLSLVRSIPFSNACLKKTRWQRSKGTELKGRVLGLVGCGEIGKRTAKMAVGMGMQVVAYDYLPDPSWRLNNFAYVDLADLYRQADFISIGGYTYESVTRATVEAVENLINALK